MHRLTCHVQPDHAYTRHAPCTHHTICTCHVQLDCQPQVVQRCGPGAHERVQAVEDELELQPVHGGRGQGQRQNRSRLTPRLRLTPVKVNALALTEAELEVRPVLPADEADEVVQAELRVPLEDRPDSSEVRRGAVR